MDDYVGAPRIGATGCLRAAILALLVAGSAFAQECTYELEPNDTPGQATLLTGAGPDAVGGQRRTDVGTVCLAGHLGSSDQDAFVWVVDDVAAAHRWVVDIESVPGQLTRLDILSVEFAPNGTDVLSFDRLFGFGTQDGAFRTSGEFLLAPGRYVIGLSVSGGSGDYVAMLRPVEALGLSGANRFNEGQRRNAPFGVFGPATGVMEQSFTVSDDDGGFAWSVELLASLGDRARLIVEGPSGVIAQTEVTAEGRARLGSLGLEPGDYTARVTGDVGMAWVMVARDGRITDGQAVEPNDNWQNANLFPVGSEMRGTVFREDYFRIEVDEAGASTAWDLVVEASSEVTLTLMSEDGTTLQERAGVAGTLGARHLAQGVYQLRLRAAQGTTYSLAWRRAAVAAADFEREPNDGVTSATSLGSETQARGVLEPQDIDVFRLDVTGEAQLYRLQVVGPGVERLSLLEANGRSSQVSVQGEGRLRIDDLLLLPGSHFIEVRGSSGEYALRALSLGPAPPPEPTADAPTPDQPLQAAAAGPSEPEAQVSNASPAMPSPPAGPPPPPGLMESEPNDDATRAQRLWPNEVHVGRLGHPNDWDYYRFYLAEDQFVRIELMPPDEGISLAMQLSDRSWVESLLPGSGGPAVAEAWFLAGDHQVVVRNRSGPAPQGYYQLRLTLLGSLALPADLEPNNDRLTASTIPAELTWEGRVGEMGGDEDFYRLPVFLNETRLKANLLTDARVSLALAGETGTVSHTVQDGIHVMVLPAGRPSWLRVTGRGPYSIELEFEREPDPAQLLPPRGGGVLAVSIETPTTELAAFWHEAQVLTATARIENLSAQPQTARLVGAVSDARAAIELIEEVTLAPGETAELPLTVSVPADARDDLDLLVELRADTASGSAHTAVGASFMCEAPPLNPVPHRPLPEALLGRLDALWDGLGAAIHGESIRVVRDTYLLDDRTNPANGGLLGANHAPTFELAGGQPVTLIAALLHPLADGSTPQQLRRFRIETSLDGVIFAPALEAELKAARIEQAFAFDAPITARYVRIIGIDSQDGSESSYLGELKLLAQDPSFFGRLNLALPELGGHVVWSEPRLAGRYGNAVLTPGTDIGSIDLNTLSDFTFVVGFHHGRAAQVSELSWRESEKGLADPAGMLSNVTVEVSLSGAAGPWEPVADWELQRDSDGVATLRLEVPTWARYIRFRVAKPEVGRMFWPPEQLSVFEREAGAGYLSALGAWGHQAKEAVFEYLQPRVTVVAVESDVDNDVRERATPLASGAVMEGTVEVARDVDWYRLTVGEGENHLSLRLSGDPSIAYRYELYDSQGRPMGFDQAQDADGETLTLFAEPGDYYLYLEEPKRTVVFAWDTSGSVGPYLDITYNSLAGFARDVDGDREAVQLLAFADPTPRWLLPIWTSDTTKVQRAIVDFDRIGGSSNSESAMLAATRALAGREGTRAILLITDAESGGAALTTQLWHALAEVGPRVFTFEISSGGSDYAQDLMQDWAASGSGFYTLATGVGSFDAGFSRADCLLRRPKRYRVEVQTAYVAPPGPGSLSVVSTGDGPEAAVQVIFDASGSMGRNLPSGEQRITAAKRALEELVGRVLPEGAPFALRAFGHIAPSSCETRLDVRLGPLDRGAALAAVRAIEPKLLSQTPLADSLAAVAGDLAGATAGRSVILITDGVESCGGDPAEAVRALRATGPLDLRIISLGLEPDAQTEFEALAEAVGAGYVDVTSFEGLAASLEAALNPVVQFEVVDAAGEVVARGIVDGEPIELTMGVYTVRVLAGEVEEFTGVRVPGEQSVTVTVGR